MIIAIYMCVYTKQVMHNAIVHHLVINAQSDSEKQPTPSTTFQLFNVLREVIQYGISLWQVCVSCHGSVPSQLAGQHKELKSPWLNVSTALQQLKHKYVIYIILNLNPKYDTITSTKGKINSIPAHTRTTDYKL